MSKMDRRSYLKYIGAGAVAVGAAGGAAWYLTRPPEIKKYGAVMEYGDIGSSFQDVFSPRYKEQVNPNVEFEYELLGTGSIEVLRTRMAAGEIPDFFENSCGSPGETLIRLGGVMNLREYFDKYNVFDRIKGGDPAKNAGSAAVLMSFSPKDNVEDMSYHYPPASDADPYWIPTNGATWGFFYNPKIFNDHSVDPPETYDEYLDTCEVLKEAGVIPMALSAILPWEVEHYWDYLLCNVPNGIYDDPDLVNDTMKGSASFTDPPYLKAIELYQVARDNNYFQAGCLGMESAAVDLLFTEGRAAMYCQGLWQVPVFEQTSPDFEFEVVPGVVPTPRSDKLHIQLGGFSQGIGISPDVKDPDTLADFICEFCTRPEQAGYWVEEWDALAAYEGIPDPDDSRMKEAMKYLDKTVTWVNAMYGSEITQRLRLNLKKFINFEMDGEELCQDLEEYTDTLPVRQG